MKRDLKKILIQEIDGNHNIVDENGIDLKKDALSKWYDITKRLIDFGYDLKKRHIKAKDGKKIDWRRFNDAVKDFGWSEHLEDGVFLQPSLPENSPYMKMLVLYEVENTAVKQNHYSKKQALDSSWIASSAPEKSEAEYRDLTLKRIELLSEINKSIRDLDDPERVFLDESAEVKKLYSESVNEGEALKDIRSVKVLSERYDNIWNELESKYNFNREELKRSKPITEDAILKALEIGYTAGKNANTTDALRRMNGSNNRNNSN